MILHQVKRDTNKFCGPAAISAIAGIWTSEAAALLRELTGKRSIKGTYAHEVLIVLCNLGYSCCEIEVLEDETLGQWLKTFPRDYNRLYLIAAAHHWQVVSLDKYVCSKTIIPVSLSNPYVPRKARIKAIYEITEATAI